MPPDDAAPVTTAQDAPLWRTPAFWTLCGALLGCLGNLFPSLDATVRALLPVVTSMGAMLIADQRVRMVNMRDLVGTGLVLQERNGEVVDPTTIKPPSDRQ